MQTKTPEVQHCILLSNGIEQSIFNSKKINNIGKYTIEYALATPGNIQHGIGSELLQVQNFCCFQKCHF